MRETSGEFARGGVVVRTLLSAIALSLGLLVQPSTVVGAGQLTEEPYIKPLKRKEPYRLYVFGDSFAAELADGLRWALRDRKDVTVIKRTKAATGLVRDDVYDWMAVIREVLDRREPQIVVIAMGGNDRQDMRVAGRRLERFSEPWRAEYLRRVDRLLSMLNESGAAVYWVGLPSVRSSQMTRDYRRFNAYFRQATRRYDMVFLDVEKLFAGEDGGYSAYGKALDGRMQRLRDGDGIHLTVAGSQKLGEFVARRIRADLRAAAAASRSAN